MDAELLKQINPKDFYEAHLREGVRPDTRELHESRKCAITINEEEQACMVRLGNTSVVCKVQQEEAETFPALSFLGKGNISISVIADDGNAIEAVGLCYQILNGTDDFMFPFTYCEVFKHFVRDPNKEEDDLSDCFFTVFVGCEKFNLVKHKGGSVALADLEKIVRSLDGPVERAKKNLKILAANKSFIGDFYN